MKFEINIPEVIRAGRKCRFALVPLIPGGAVLFVCGKHSVGRIEKEMLPLLEGRKVFIRTPFAGEPHLDEVDELLDFARNEQVSAVIGWGGGSAIDGAKAVAALCRETLPAAEYFYNRAEAGVRSVFFAAVPTTAGTGAEVTANAVLTDRNTGIKQSLRTAGMTADAAFVDPELVDECPAGVMASSGFDALTQAVESFISLKSDALTSSIARSAVRDIFLNLEMACRHFPASVDAVTLGCLNAGIAFSKSGLGAVHGLAHPVGSLLSVPHGTCCAVLLTAVLEFNLPVVREKLDELASVSGAENAEDFIRKIAVLRRKLAVPENFSAYGLAEKHFKFIADNCRSGSMKCNPRVMTDDDVVELMGKLK